MKKDKISSFFLVILCAFIWLFSINLVNASSNEVPNYTVAVSTYEELENRLNRLVSKYENTYWTTNGLASNSNGTTSKYYYGIQCKGFASYIFNDLFFNGYIGAYDSSKYYIPNPKGAYLIEKSASVGSSDITTVKNILSQGQIGDFIQVHRRGKSYGHSMILAGKDDGGIWIFDCNSDGKCGVKHYYQSWATFASKNDKMSLYHATNYPDSSPDWWLTDPLVYNDEYYAENNPDLQGMTPEERRNHWLQYGIAEAVKGRQASPVFQAKWYLYQETDLSADAVVGQSYQNAIHHFVANGVNEWRNSSAEFNAKVYKENYLDLQNAFGDNCRKYVEHYLYTGRREGRIANERLRNRYNANGGNLPSGVSEIQLVVGNAPYGKLPIPTRDGYAFDGWYTDASGGQRIDSGTQRSGNELEVILYAHWTLEGEEMTAGYKREIPDGDYLIVAETAPDKSSYYYLDIAGSESPAISGTNVTIHGPLKDEPKPYDVWTLSYKNGFYKILQKGTDGQIALDLEGASRKQGANVQAHAVNDSSAQKWAISKNPSGAGYRIQAKCSGLSLDIAGANIAAGTNVQQWASYTSWLFIPYKPAQPLEEGKYILLSGVDEKYELDVPGDTGDVADQTKMQVWEDTAPSRYNSFEVTKLSNGYYKLIHSASGKALEVYGGGSGVMDRASLMEWNGSNAQQWAITKDGDNGGYLLRVKSSGYALDLIDAKTENGAPVRQYYYNGSKAETWMFVKAEYTITLDPNGGATNWNEKIKNYNESLWLSSAYSPSRTGYDFLGWTEAGRDSVRIDYVQGSYYDKNEDVTLYAVWKKLELDIILPSNLEIIKEEAFSEGTFTYVKIPEGATMIESRAFADCKNMKYIEIPKSTTSISSDAFLGTNNLTILGDNGSYAEYYAQKNGFNFAVR